MDKGKMISISTVCLHYELEPDFMAALRENGLIEIIELDNDLFVEEEHLSELETILRLHHDLEINLAGIEAISHLLRRIREMQQELLILRNKQH